MLPIKLDAIWIRKIYLISSSSNLYLQIIGRKKMSLYLDTKADLDTIFQSIENICARYDIPSTQYKDTLYSYYEYKCKLTRPEHHGHYDFCIWSKDNCVFGPDTCECWRLRLRPKQLVNSLIADIGLDLILGLIQEEKEQEETRQQTLDREHASRTAIKASAKTLPRVQKGG